MSNEGKLHNKFKISYDDLSENDEIKAAYDAYESARSSFGAARVNLNETRGALHALLDEPLRNGGLVPPEKEWSLVEDEEDFGLVITVWQENRRRGRKKAQPEKRELKLNKQSKAA